MWLIVRQFPMKAGWRYDSLALFKFLSWLFEHVEKRSSLIYNTRARYERHECNKSATLATQVRRECYTNDISATRTLHERYTNDTSATRVQTYFHTIIFIIWQMKDYKERNNFILTTTFRKYLFPMQKCV